MSTSKPTNYLKPYDETSLPDLDDCIIESGDQVRFTSKGQQRYGVRFGKAGIDIGAIKTLSQLKYALRASFHIEMEEFVDRLKDNPGDPLEKACLAAVALGDTDELERLKKIIEHRNRLADGKLASK
jgi:hypothetical protein